MLSNILVGILTITWAASAWAADLYAPAYVPPISDPVYTPNPMIVGQLELGVGVVDHSECSDCNHGGGIFVGAGRANLPLSHLWNLEIEIGGGAWFRNGESFSAIGALGHLWRRLDNAAVGVFGGAYNDRFELVEGTVGLEGKAYLGNLTLGGSGSYSWGDEYYYWMALAGADFYLTPELRLSGEASYYEGDVSGFSLEHWNSRVIGEYHFAGTPLTGWTEASYTDYGDDFGHEWAGIAGVRLLLNSTAGTTLQQHDRQVPWHEIIGSRLYFQ